MADRMAVRHPGRFKFAGDQVEAALALGDVDRAQAVVERLDEAARVAPTPWVVAVGARSAALVAAARGDLDGALDRLTTAIEAHDNLPMPFERGRTLLAKGRLHRRRKEKRLADEALREALACFESLGAPDWAAITRAELGRVGRRPHAPDGRSPTPSGGSPSSRPQASPAARSPSARSSPPRPSATSSAGSTRSSGSTRGPSSGP